MNQPLKVVSLFDGISCGRLALERAGYAVSSYDAFEIDKFARAVSRYNYPDTVHHGDVLDADFKRFVGADVVMGGSPCTFWSIAKTNREIDKDGIGWKLFMRFVEAVRLIRPRFFLYENVASMPANIKAYIAEELGCEPVLINSALLSAQHRKRLYWTNISGVTQPEDKGILLRDILQSGLPYQEKSHCMGTTIGAASFIQIIAPELTDRMLADFLNMDNAITVNLHIRSIDQTEAIKTIKRKITDLDAMKIAEQKKAVRSGYDMLRPDRMQ